MLSCYVNKSQNDWDKHLQKVAYYYNSTAQASTKLSPFEVLYGIKSFTIPATTNQVRPNDYVNPMNQKRQLIEHIVKGNADKARERQQNEYNNRNNTQKYKQICVKDIIVLKNYITEPGLSRKLTRKYLDPMIVINVINEQNYLVQDKTGKSQIVHHNRMVKIGEAKSLAEFEQQRRQNTTTQQPQIKHDFIQSSQPVYNSVRERENEVHTRNGRIVKPVFRFA
jgi:hypothetical protein